MAEKSYYHFTQAFGLTAKEEDLDFFDPNLTFDSRLFIDPFLLKRSPIKEEQDLYQRFEKYFEEALRRTIAVLNKESDEGYLYEFLTFPEPKELCIGYTELTTTGSGLGGKFATSMTAFFLKGIAFRIKEAAKETETKNNFNPDLFRIFADEVADDGISDLTGNLIIDYLVKYTQAQCSSLGIKTQPLTIRQSFNFDTLDWTGGMQVMLPENPLKPGTGVILIPKRLLRGTPISNDQIKSKTVQILQRDPILIRRFSRLVSTPIASINISEIRLVLIEDKDSLQRFVDKLDRLEDRERYDFIRDPLEFMSIKKYEHYYDSFTLPPTPESCDDFINLVDTLIDLFKEDYEVRDNWKDCWIANGINRYSKECIEPAWGRSFRAKALGYFHHYPQVTFVPEAGSGNGFVDFLVVYLDCRVTIEIKKLSNYAPTGKLRLPAYIHGIKVQLPGYTTLHKASHARYITGQHRFKNRPPRCPTDHTHRVTEINEEVGTIEKDIQSSFSDFQNLKYINIDLAPKPSLSKK